MSGYLTLNGQGAPYSLSPSQPSVVPSGYSVVTLDDPTYLGMIGGQLIWQNGSTVTNPTYAAQQVINTTAADLLVKARTALTTLTTFEGTIAARRTAIASDKATATTMQTATVTTVAQAQTQVRSIGLLLTHVATALDDLNNEAEANAKQLVAIIKLLAGEVMGATDLLQDETGT